MKEYEVTLNFVARLIVEADNEEEAIHNALDEYTAGDITLVDEKVEEL